MKRKFGRQKAQLNREFRGKGCGRRAAGILMAAALFLAALVPLLPTMALATENPGEGGVAALSETVDSMNTEAAVDFLLWLYLCPEDGTAVTESNRIKIAGYAKDIVNWDPEHDLYDALDDVLRITGSNYYLIPVSYFEQTYAAYGYTFYEWAECPFRYAPSAYSSAGNLTYGSYVQVDGIWYVQIADTGVYSGPANSRSNIYYTQGEGSLSAAGQFRYWPHINEEVAGAFDTASAYHLQGTTDYLIPVTEIEENMGISVFEESDPANCPLQYAPDATDTNSRVDAEYVQVNGIWYLRVQDAKNGGYDDSGIPRCNIYYDTASMFTLWVWAKEANEEGQIANVQLNTYYLNLSEIVSEDENYYLIPVSRLKEAYGEYGYVFDPEDPGECPFVYAPNAAQGSSNLTEAAYVQEGDDWYVRVQDTTGLKSPRSNLYYLGMKSDGLVPVDNFLLWPHINTEESLGTFEIETALQVEDTDYYLIPVSEIEKAFGGYYEFSIGECFFRYAPDAGSPNTKEAGSYVQADGVWYLLVRDKQKGVYPAYLNGIPRCNIYYTGVVKDTVSHPNTVINLFDYWLTAREDADWTDHLEGGINAGHALKFRVNETSALSEWNRWTGSASVRQGIVANTLTDGYPVLAENISGESLAYLFDPDMDAAIDGVSYRAAYRNVGGLLQIDPNGYYCYDSGQNFAEYKEDTNSFTLYNQSGVLPGGAAQTNGQFFPFNSVTEVAQLTSTNQVMNHYFGLTLSTRFIQQYDGYTNSSRNTVTTFEFAGDDDVWIFIDDVLVADLGGIHDAARVEINFKTGVVSINNGSNQSTTLWDAFTTAGAEDTVTWNADKTTFANNTTHTLRFFYLERGNIDSNLYLRYNLTEIPVTSIFKVDQYGENVKDAGFAVYASNSNWEYLLDKDVSGGEADSGTEEYISLENVSYTVDEATGVITIAGGAYAGRTITPKYSGKTDSAGEMIFTDEDDVPYSLKELQNKFGGDHFILREIRVPPGYRLVSDEIRLYIQNNVLFCDNTYTSGVWSAATNLVTATDTIYLYGGSGYREQTFYDSATHSAEGTMFAVVLKYIGEADGDRLDEKNWAPVYGSDRVGYTVVNTGEFENFKEAVIYTANMAQKYGDVVFSLSSSGSMQVELTNLPGDVRTYYYMLEQNGGDPETAQYAVAYYWADVDGLNGVTADNISRVMDTKGTITVDGNSFFYDGFDRVFGAAIRVPNLINRLFAQKMDENGNLVNGAVFALYQVEEITDGESGIYYIAEDDTRIELDPEADREVCKGKARIRGTEELYEYSFDGVTGVITVDTGTGTYTIPPAKNASGEDMVDETGDGAISGETGTCEFSNLYEGTYYLREIAAPPGYEINSTQIMVLVTGDTIYANAGGAGDGVTVARGPGYVVSTLAHFASEGDIDMTLTWIYAMLKVKESDSFHIGSYSDWDLAADRGGTPAAAKTKAMRTYLKYDPGTETVLFNYGLNEDNDGTYFDWDGGDLPGTGHRRLYTDVGWSYLEIYQDHYFALKAEGTGAVEGVNYRNLQADVQGNEDGSKDMDISNLFSRSVFVQVTDERLPGNLKISKTVTAEEGAESAPPEETFEFTVNLYEIPADENNGAVKIPLTGAYRYAVYKQEEAEEDPSPVLDENGDPVTGTILSGGTISLKDGQTAVIENLPAGTGYTITEEIYKNFEVTAVRDAGKPPGDDEGTGDQKFSGRTVSGTLYWKVDADGNLDNTSTVDYTNCYVPDRTALTVIKQDAEDSDVKLNGVAFKLEKLDAQNEIISGWEKTDTTAGITDGKPDGIAAFTGLENGAYLLTEVRAAEGYNLLKDPIRITIHRSEGENWYAIDDGEPVQLAEDADTITITVKNRKALVLPNTGGAGRGLPYYLKIVGAVQLIAAILACVFAAYGKEGKKKRGHG